MRWNLHDTIPKPADLIVILGPTASGKSDVAEHLAANLGGEVVGMSFFIELSFLNARKRFEKYPIHSLIQY